jgi:hypothetical protein
MQTQLCKKEGFKVLIIHHGLWIWEHEGNVKWFSKNESGFTKDLNGLGFIYLEIRCNKQEKVGLL